MLLNKTCFNFTLFNSTCKTEVTVGYCIYNFIIHLMSKSHEIIDPSLYAMIEKILNQNILSIENDKLKRINFIIFSNNTYFKQ